MRQVDRLIKAPVKAASDVFQHVLKPALTLPTNVVGTEFGNEYLRKKIKGGLSQLPRDKFDHDFKSLNDPFTIKSSIDIQNKRFPEYNAQIPVEMTNHLKKSKYSTNFKPMNIFKGMSPFVHNYDFDLDTHLSAGKGGVVKSPKLQSLLDAKRTSMGPWQPMGDFEGKFGSHDPKNQQYPRSKIPWSTGEGMDGAPMRDPYEPKPMINTARWNKEEAPGSGVAYSDSPVGYGKDPKMGLSNFRRADKPKSLGDL